VAGERWIVDGMNVIGSRPDGWWRDRRGAMSALAEELGKWAQGRSVTVVFDGKPFALDVDGVDVMFASRRGRDAADDDIVRIVRGDPAPDELLVATSDADLARRVEELGAEVVGARTLRHMLDQ
jgi:predicted RNA-binding protein with PIN domain